MLKVFIKDIKTDTVSVSLLETKNNDQMHHLFQI